jgi:hypothetical protein
MMVMMRDSVSVFYILHITAQQWVNSDKKLIS